uniref:LITAF domain-containing protein n=1 Tax=Tetraselmis sp. GSL018 TaxID=582737 RepID=A0A061RBT5_9CHLO
MSKSYQGGPQPASGYPGVQPYPGIPVRTLNTIQPRPGEVIVRYAIVEPRAGCCECEDLTVTGWVATGCLAVFFWPAMFLPCCIPGCHEKYQIPIYGDPRELPQGYVPPPSGAPKV